MAHAVIAVGGIAASATAQAPVDLRIALVIGNSAYAGNAALSNPAKDAEAMSAALRKLGFHVTELRDGSRAQMAEAVAAVRRQLQGRQGVGMLYYAGHGLQIDWRNYMLPVDARPVSQADIVAQAVDVDSVLEAFKQAGNRMNILVLDACRDNPFEGTASAKGLAQVDAPPGTFLAYATAPGNTADDGANGNGLYTGFLLQELVRPTARIEDVFKRVRLQVRQKSAGRQIPWESTSLEEDFVFNDGRLAGAPPPPAPARPSERQLQAEREQAFERDKAQWDRIKNSRNPEDFYAFLQASPNGPISEAAQDRLDQLAKPAVVPTPVQGRATIQRDPRVGDEVEYVYRDYLTKLETRRETLRVTSVKDGFIEFNNGEQIITVSGGTVRNDGGAVFDPPLQVLPVGQFQIGRQWTTRSMMTLPGRGQSLMGMAPASRQMWVEQAMKVLAYEEITVPAGTFKAYKLHAEMRSQDGTYGNIHYWVGESGAVLRYERRARRANGADHSWIRDVVRFHRPR